MSRQEITITSGATTRSAAAWGVALVGRHLEAQSRDVVTLVQRVARFDEADIFEHNSFVTILRGGVRWFHGRVLCGASAKTASHTKTYRVVGGWLELERRQYLQDYQEGGDYGRVILSQTGTDRIDNLAGARKAVQYAIDHGAPLQIGTIATGVKMVPEIVSDMLCAEIVRKELRWTPDAVPYFDYSTAPTTLHIRRASAMPVISVPVGSFADDLRIEPAFEFAIHGVVVKIKSQPPSEGNASIHSSNFGVGRYGSGTTLEGEDGIILFSMDEGDFLSSGGVSAGNPALIIATALFQALRGLGWRGSGTLKAADLPGLRLGQRINITGTARAEWGAMKAVIQSIDESVDSGSQTITFGPPARMNVGDMLGLLKAHRQRRAVPESLPGEIATGENDEQTYGFDGSDGEKAGGLPEGFVQADIEVIRDNGGSPVITVVTHLEKPIA